MAIAKDALTQFHGESMKQQEQIHVEFTEKINQINERHLNECTELKASIDRLCALMINIHG